MLVIVLVLDEVVTGPGPGGGVVGAGVGPAVLVGSGGAPFMQ